ncbi:MAG: hypothetical protein V1766_12505, partial [Pseudomonadota bacterium]
MDTMDSMDKGITYQLTYKDVVDIMKIVDESICRELHLEIGDFKLDLVKGHPVAGPAANPCGKTGAAGENVRSAADQAAVAQDAGIAGKKK